MDLYKSDIRRQLALRTRNFKEVKANRTGLNMEDWDGIFDVMLGYFGEELEKGNRLYLPFGVFYVKPLNNIENNPILHMNENTKFRKYRVMFRPSEKLKNMANGFDTEDIEDKENENLNGE